jgi:TRAP-type mannitol/chloroaromatic compound transport system substrate-binding protein
LFYYHPGWWEPGTALEVEIHLDNWNSLPEEYQAAIETAAAYANMHCLATYDTLNQRDLQKIKEFATILEFSPELMAAFKQGTEDEMDRIAGEDARFAAILGPWREYRDGIVEWHGLAERSYLMQQTESDRKPLRQPEFSAGLPPDGFTRRAAAGFLGNVA